VVLDCGPVRSWFVIPAMGVVCGGAAVALGISPVVALAGAALAGVVRVLAGDSPAALSGAVIAPILAVASFADAGGELGRAALALAAAGWAVTELARPAGSPTSPLVAVLPAAVAGLLDPSFAALLAFAGARLITLPGAPRAKDVRGPGPASDRLSPVPTPWQRPRWVLAVPVAGAIMIALAVLGGTAWPALGARWFGAAAHPVSAAALAGLAAATLGPVTAVAALAGTAALVRPRYAEFALVAMLAGAVLVDLRAGALGPVSIGLAALLSGLAIARLAAMIRMPSGQAVVGATIGVLVVVPPAWSAVAQRPSAAHTGQASR
jgi:hypothetical protein